jgi:hypothetical protein
MMRAPKAHDKHSPHLLVIELAIQLPICRCKNGLGAVQSADPIQQQHWTRSVQLRCCCCGRRPPAAGDLEEDDAEAVGRV